MLPLLPFHGREFAALLAYIGRSISRAALTPRAVAASAAIAAAAFVITASVLFVRLLTLAPPRLG